MDHHRPLLTRQRSVSGASASSATATPSEAAAAAQSSPMMSPANRHVRSGSAGGAAGPFRRRQNTAARAAAQRLARVMAHQPAEGDASSDDDDDDDASSAATAPLPELSTPRRSTRSPSPALGRYLAEQTSTIRHTSAGRPSMVAKASTIIPPIKPAPKPVITSLATDSPAFSRREKMMSVDLGNLNMREKEHSRSSSAFQDEIEMLQEENENILEKLHLAEERCEEAESKAKQLGKQVTSFGEGMSHETKLLKRKEAALQKREDTLKTAARTSNAKNEQLALLQEEAKAAKDEAASVSEHLHVAESELRTLRTIAQKMILSQEEMEEVVLKRCWLARYWKLCVNHGIHADIAEVKHAYWSSLAPLPLEVVLSAGQKAKDECSSEKPIVEDRDKVSWDINDIPGEGNIESMILAEKGLCELASLKVEDAVLLAMSQHRRPTIKSFSGPLVSAEAHNPVEAFDLSEEESEDVQFKQAWLAYFWRRAKNHGLEEDIADERLQFWIEQSNHSPTSHDVLAVERGLFELKKLGIESQLWEAMRRGKDYDADHHESPTGSEK
ncbi:coiled-coil domain-containing protein SCD2-like isoform X2 [Ananas comosus]|uniref:Coiled-coil domain-containing protein SCD2-like isoform X2 n=1 Tax=Ananas comosus TaxID=4615 RepID=A0A6P5HFS9_ANACO|nr:coiled-coil domain-containing protein SCD2-like isoform X2 [Ananas comosus]